MAKSSPQFSTLGPTGSPRPPGSFSGKPPSGKRLTGTTGAAGSVSTANSQPGATTAPVGLGSTPVTELSGRGTLQAQAEVLTATPVVPTLYPAEPGGTVIVQNSITININGVEAQQLFSKLDALFGELDKSNRITGELRDQLKNEIAAGRSVLSAPKANRNLVDLLLVRPLRWLAEKAGSAIISKLAVDALDLLSKLLGS